MTKFYLIFVLTWFCFLGLKAQESQIETDSLVGGTQYDWQIGVSMFATDHTAVRGLYDGYFDFSDYSFVPFPAKLTFVRGLNRSLDLDVTANLGQVDNKRLGVDNEFMINATMGLRYRFANGYILKQTSWFDPYLRLGAGYHHFDYQGLEFNNFTDLQGHPIYNGAVANSDFFTITGGVGMNFWVWEKTGFNLMSEYYHMPGMTGDNIDFFQHSAGVVFRFGDLDRDKDGILDKDDECPDTPGLAEFNGCPDTDGDGLPDQKDDCPLDPGPMENNGCPYLDADKDGILDADDQCPNTPGIIDYNGCPPPAPVPPVVEEKPEPIPPKVKYVFDDVFFKFDSSKINEGGEDAVTEIANEMKKEGGEFFVDGHTDKRGSEAYNEILSRKRAQSVKDALVKEGIPAESLEVRGLGEMFPLCEQTTEECYQKNRRVEILRKDE